MTEIQGYLRSDGRKGIRNVLLVAYLVECAHHVAREIVLPYRDQSVQLIGFSGCYPNAYAANMMQQLCTHPNVGGVLLVSLGCEGFNRGELASTLAKTGRPVQTLVIQETRGTRKTIEQGQAWVEQTLKQMQTTPRVKMTAGDLIVGTICGGSDVTSGLTANPAVGRAFDLLVDQGAAVIFEETGELLGCEQHMAQRAATPALGKEIIDAVAKASQYYQTLGHGSFAPGNAQGGLTTQEEKSLGAYAKSGSASIVGLLKPGDRPTRGGLYLLDVIPDGEVRFGFPNINDNAEIAELIACGCHMILFTTGRGSVVGSVISPVLKICANPQTYQSMADDMDINAGRMLEGTATREDIGRELFETIFDTARGTSTASERLGHQEFVLTYKSFEPVGPSCLPMLQ